jgi:hypothetical protein
MPPMIVRRARSTRNPLQRWRWQAAGMFGYTATRRGAAAAARLALRDPHHLADRIADKLEELGRTRFTSAERAVIAQLAKETLSDNPQGKDNHDHHN